jgi:hypothetical protein
MRKVDYKGLSNVLNGHYHLKTPLIIMGGFGIGKSGIIENTSRRFAIEENREFKNFFKENSEEQKEIEKHPEKYYSLIDVRMSERDVSDIKGLMSLKDTEEYIKFKTERWLGYVTKPESSGIIFFDEFNLASPMVLSNIYKIVYDRIVNDTLISKNWFIVMSGNRENDGAFTFSIPKPLKDRASEVELTPDFEGWKEWAIDNGIHHTIVTYLCNVQTHFYKVDDEDNQKYVTPRGWNRVSEFQKSKLSKQDRDECIKVTIGEGVAIQYLKYIELQNKINVEEIIKTPEKMKEIDDVSIKYLLIGILAEKYKNEDKQVNFEKIIKISEVLDGMKNTEFVTLLWKFCISYTRESGKFENDFQKKADDDMVTKYSQYIL